MTPTSWRTVLFGAGKVGAGYSIDPVMASNITYATHAQVLAEHPGFEWGAVVDHSLVKARGVASRWRVPIVSKEVDDAIVSYRPQIAVLAIPPKGRVAIVESLEDLTAVLVEKPLGNTLDEAEEFLRACARREITVQVNLWRRSDRLFRELAGGRLAELVGSPQSMNVIYGNGLANNGTHMIDFIRMFAGDFAHLQALSSRGRGFDNGDRDVTFQAALRSGASVAFQTVDFSKFRENAVDVWGTHGRLSIFSEGMTTVAYPVRPSRQLSHARELADEASTLTTTIGDAFYRMYENLFEFISNRGELWSPGCEALEVARVVDAVLRSLDCGGEIVEIVRTRL